jgi:hypothetical protein
MTYVIIKARIPFNMTLYKIVNMDSKLIHSKHTNLKKAEMQVRLLNARAGRLPLKQEQ